MQKSEQFGAALAICAALWSSPSVSAQCQAPDGSWHDYASPMCQPPKPAPAPKAPEEPPWYFEPGIKFGDLDAHWAMILRGVAREKGWPCETISAVRSCVWGCGYRLDCDNYTRSYELTTRGTHVVVEAK